MHPIIGKAIIASAVIGCVAIYRYFHNKRTDDFDSSSTAAKPSTSPESEQENYKAQTAGNFRAGHAPQKIAAMPTKLEIASSVAVGHCGKCSQCKSSTSGRPKYIYRSNEEAEAQADYRKRESGLWLKAYKCPAGFDYHLRTRVFYSRERVKKKQKEMFEKYGHILDVKSRKKRGRTVFYLAQREYETKEDAQKARTLLYKEREIRMYLRKMSQTGRYVLCAILQGENKVH